MPRIRQLAALTGAAALALTAVGTPAYAGTTEIREVAPPNNPYSGPATGTLTGNLSVQAEILGSTTTTTCTSASLSGSVDSDGEPMSITSASVSGCSGLASSITFNTPWTGDLVYAPDLGTGRDAVLTLDDFSVQATVRIGLIQVNCVYGGTVSVDGFNGSGTNPAWVDMAGTVIENTGGSFLCPDEATITAGVFELTGSGGKLLYVTGTP